MHYWNDAGTMAGGDSLTAHGFVEIIRTPGYPFFLALLQLAFGRYSLVAAVVCEQCMVFATAMVAAWMWARISGSRLGGLCGLVLGLFWISQNSVANRLLSDTLFGLLLTLTVAVFVAWCERPAATAAVAIGFLLGNGHAGASDRAVRLGAGPPPWRSGRHRKPARPVSSSRRRTNRPPQRSDPAESGATGRGSRATATSSGASATGAHHTRLKRGNARMRRTPVSSAPR